ncbi:hypothetical protein D1B31_11380 [Neobacillus notoginsengisoli]|uniref:Uncharacterized protein n=1 Tax=Neobacillus notoginsengisoli TaxID=1578198 RepID=A0A417YUG4_9BACI|nr:hypothetical protein D1B31_11380 [Neobacillus notoginsengisoli]
MAASPLGKRVPRDRQRSPVSAMQIPWSFPLCPCDDYSKKLSFAQWKSTTRFNTEKVKKLKMMILEA